MSWISRIGPGQECIFISVSICGNFPRITAVWFYRGIWDFNGKYLGTLRVWAESWGHFLSCWISADLWNMELPLEAGYVKKSHHISDHVQARRCCLRIVPPFIPLTVSDSLNGIFSHEPISQHLWHSTILCVLREGHPLIHRITWSRNQQFFTWWFAHRGHVVTSGEVSGCHSCGVGESVDCFWLIEARGAAGILWCPLEQITVCCMSLWCCGSLDNLHQ